MSTWMYNPFNGVVPGFFAVLALLAVGFVALWYSRSGSSRVRNLLTAILAIGSAFVQLAVCVHLVLTQIDFAERGNFDAIPSINFLAIVAGGAVLTVVFGVVVHEVERQHLLRSLAAMAMFFAVFTSCMETCMYRFYQDHWALATSVGWILLVVTLVTLFAAVAVTRLHAYGDKRYQQGKLDALDSKSVTGMKAPA